MRRTRLTVLVVLFSVCGGLPAVPFGGTGAAMAQAVPHLGRYILGSGPVRELKLPDGWTCKADAAAQDAPRTLCRKGSNPKFRVLSIMARRASPETLRKVFSSIPNSITVDSLAPDLLTDEIRAVSPILGPRADNQYVNIVSPPSQQAPTFHLTKIEYVATAGRLMLKTEGAFMDPDGQRQNFDQAVVTQMPDGSANLVEIAMTSPLTNDVENERELFSEMVATIAWAQ